MVIKAGKTKWVVEREDRVFTTEKGLLKTYWLAMGCRHSGLDQADISHELSLKGDGDSDRDEGEFECQQRFIEWTVEVFKGLLKQIIARRASLIRWANLAFNITYIAPTIPLEEVKETNELPEFDRKSARRQRENVEVEVLEKVV